MISPIFDSREEQAEFLLHFGSSILGGPRTAALVTQLMTYRYPWSPDFHSILLRLLAIPEGEGFSAQTVVPPRSSVIDSQTLRHFLQFNAIAGRALDDKGKPLSRMALTPGWSANPNLLDTVFAAAPSTVDKSRHPIQKIHLLHDCADQNIRDPRFPEPAPDDHLRIEGLAWFSSYHNHLDADWGIYFDATRILDGIRRLMDKTGISFTVARRYYVHMLLHHELLHARVEIASAWMELMSSASIYLAKFGSLSGKRRMIDAEEAVATAIGFDTGEAAVRQIAGSTTATKIRAYAEDSVSRLSGYNDSKSSSTHGHTLATEIAGEPVGNRLHDAVYAFLMNPGQPTTLPRQGPAKFSTDHDISFDDTDIPLWVIGDEPDRRTLFPGLGQ